MNSAKIKKFCSEDTCSFKPVRFNTFEYMYCSTCKNEVDEDLVERKARYKALKESPIINPHMDGLDDEYF